MRNSQTVNNLIEAQFHYFESGSPEKAATIVGRLMEPLYNLGRYPELLGILRNTIEKVDDLDSRFYIYQARALMALGRADEALAILQLVHFEVEDDPELQAAILVDKGGALRRMGEFWRADEIIKDYEEAYRIYSELSPLTESEADKKIFLENTATCLFGEGTVYQYFLDEPGKAIEKYYQAQEAFGQVQSPDGIADCTKQIGEIYANRRFSTFYDRDKAEILLKRALDVFESINYQKGVLETLYQLGRLRRDNQAQARKLFERYLELAGQLGLIREEAVAKRHLAELRFQEARQGEPASVDVPEVYANVTRLLNEAITVLQLFEFDIWSRRVLVNCYYQMGLVLLAQDQNETALENFKRGLQVSDEPVFEGRFLSDVRRRTLLLLSAIQLMLLMEDQLPAIEELLATHLADFELLGLPYPAPSQVREVIARLKKGE